MSARTRRTTWLAAALLAVLTTTACISVPDTGPVVPVQDEVQTQPDVGSEGGVAPPQEGQSPKNIVNGFLRAMTAYPVRTEVARQYLSSAAAEAWNPASKIITYEGRGSLRGTSTVRVALQGAHWVDSRGTWRGQRGTGDVQLSFPMVKEGDEWRIDGVVDALVVPDTWFHDRYRQASVYFLDPTASILVPEQVFVRIDQVTGSLVQALLDGPGPELDHVVRSFVPEGLTLGLSVPVSDDGRAAITLEGDVGALTPAAAQPLTYQFAWTLHQDPRIKSFSITLNKQPVTLPGFGGTQFSVDLGSEYSPADVSASSALFELRDGLLESGDPSNSTPVDGPLGQTAYGIESFAVSLKGDLAATVAANHTALALTSVADDSHPYQQVISGAGNLLKPSWDFAGRVWLVDNRRGGARVSVIDTTRDDTLVVTKYVRGISGEDVQAFMVSRDGTRLVAVVRGGDADVLRLSRIRYDALGTLRTVTPSRDLAWGAVDRQRIIDIGWNSTTTVGVLHQFTPNVAQFVAVPVDGSTGLEDRLTQTGRATALVCSPTPEETLYIRTEDGLQDTTGAEGGVTVPLPADVSAVQYVG
jgi:hypothetical protein